jgi:peptide/nickel transport system substrate-binding protein
MMNMGHARRFTLPLAAILVLVGCAPRQPDAQTNARNAAPPASPTRITAAILGDAPAMVQRLTGFGQRGTDALEELVNAGVITDDNQGLLRPVLAEAVPTIENGLWRMAADGRMETTWRLRPNARWHDGTSVTSSDLLFAAAVAQDPEVPEFGHAALGFVQAVEAVDERTVTVRWKQPYIEADRLFSRSIAGPMPRHLLQAPYAENKAAFTQLPYWNEQFIGTGPYRVRDFVAGSHVVLAANDDYLLGRPKIDVIEVRFINEPTTMVANILAGTIELTIGKTLSVEEAVEVRDRWREGRLEYAPSNAISVYPQFINPNPQVITNVQFRRALVHAIDRQQIADTLLVGLSSIAHSFLFPNQSQYREIEARLPRYDYDPRRASQIVESLGYAKGADGLFRAPNGQTLSVEARSSTTDINQKALFAIADAWQQIGVKVDPVVYSRQAGSSNEYLFTFPGFYLQRYTSDLSGLKNLHSSVIPLPENNFRSGNTSRYKNADLDALLDRYFATIPMPERIATLGEIVYHVADQLPQLGLFYDVEPTAIANRIQNVGPRWPSSTQSWNAHQWEVR